LFLKRHVVLYHRHEQRQLQYSAFIGITQLWSRLLCRTLPAWRRYFVIL